MENELKDKSGKIKLQEQLLDMLKALTDFCEQNNIVYYLAGGTLLGAVRHQGFIPWDDDVDILLPRDDYDRLVELLAEDEDGFLQKNDYSLKELRTDKTYSLPYAKLENQKISVKESLLSEESNLWIDIFPLDGLPDKRKAHMFITKLLRYCRWESACLEHQYSHRWKRWAKLILFFPLMLIGARRWAVMLDKRARRYSLDTSKQVACVVGKYMERECVGREVFATQKEVTFEGVPMKIPCGYDIYLTSLYGDYMKLPDEAKREQHM